MSTIDVSSVLFDIAERYALIVLCKDQTIELEVDEDDLVNNADGELDCPIDVVLRKNGYSFTDFNKWNAKTIQFVRRKQEEETVLKSIPLNVNL